MRHVLLILISISSVICFGRENDNDIKMKTYAVPDSVALVFGDDSALSSLSPYAGSSLNEKVSLMHLQTPVFFETIRAPKNMPQPGTAYIPLWKGGGFSASGSISVMPGLMRIDSGSFEFRQSLGNFSFYMGGVANKYGFFNGLHTQYGVTGNLLYQFSPNLSFTGFGNYYFGQPPMMGNGLPMQPAMIGYYKVSTFGGYLSYQFNETFGVDVGAKAVQQFGTDKYQLEPIVTPTVKVGKVKFGLPVGQILNGIIRSHIEERRNRR